MDRWGSFRDAALVAGLLAAAWGATYLAGGSRTALPHAFYLPIVIAGARLGWFGAVSTALTAGILAGPLMPLDVTLGTAQSVGNWLIRLGFFLAVALVSAQVNERLRRTASSEHTLAEERADLAAARSTLLQVVSHELRTPLTVIKGSLAVIDRSEDRLPPQTQLLLPAVGRALDRLEDLAEVVIAAVEPVSDERHLTEVAISAVLADAIGAVRAEFDPGRVQVSLSEERMIRTQPEPLRLVLRCLVENALKFAPADTPVEVRARVSSAGVVIEVVDHGPGIPDAFTTGELQMMLQGDTSTTRAQGGLGLGLYATRRLVERLGGELVVTRPEGGGTRVAVRLPPDAA